MPSGNFNAVITKTPPVTIDQFYATPPVTPGNVGVCLSGGGSRALTAGMGQLQALQYLNLLGSVKAISTVSGGSWLGVTYEFLPSGGPTDSTYLGTYNPNPGTLTVAQLSSLPAGNAGAPLATAFFSPEFLALEAYILWEALDVPANMLWQTIIGLNILSPCALSQVGSDLTPVTTFSYDPATWQQITAANPSLSPETAYLMADQVGGTRTRRPFLICNMGMLMTEAGGGVQLLAPVQSTAFTTGIFGAPVGSDANGQTPGGGGITSFCFNSAFAAASGSASIAYQNRQWSLTDAVGTSSAFFAEQIANQFAYWEKDIFAFWDELAKDFEDILKWIESHLPLEAQPKAKALMTQLGAKRLLALQAPHLSPAVAAPLAQVAEDAGAVEFPVLDDMIPQYYYWPMGETTPVANPQPSQFADGGSLENTGICGMLAYSDIQSIAAFVNTESPLQAGAYGVSNGSGGFIPETNIVVDDAIPPLFGYQPYDSTGGGYVLYKGASTQYPQFANSQVFASASFVTLLQGLWKNSGSTATSKATSPAIFTQSNLEVLPNQWFGIQGGQTVTVVWCYLNYAQNWVDLFAQNQPVAQLIASEVANNGFPGYSTFDTNLSAEQVNLLSAISAWSVVTAEAGSQTFSSLFKGAPAATASMGA